MHNCSKRFFAVARSLAGRALLACFLVLLVGACRAGESWVEVGGQRYYVEIADEPEEKARGLMFRDELGQNEGMFFIWNRPAPRAFWMLNTRIPLDIVYIGPELKIVGWSLDTPPCRTRSCPNYPSGAPAQYVLEVNAGEMERLGVAIGDRVRVGNIEGVETPEVTSPEVK
ncbi:MAG: DUF192 domain-containing protein [Wenzhouxiangellaceae bacterium]|nr:DUF192 domain-containing protein [Wenzhouxiangellaceae bacterium]